MVGVSVHENTIVHLAIFWLRRVDFKITELGEFTLRLALMLHTLVAAFSWRVRCHLNVKER